MLWHILDHIKRMELFPGQITAIRDIYRLLEVEK